MLLPKLPLDMGNLVVFRHQDHDGNRRICPAIRPIGGPYELWAKNRDPGI